MRQLFSLIACLLTIIFCAVGRSAAAPQRGRDRTISCQDTVSAMTQFKEKWWQVDRLPNIDTRLPASLSSSAVATPYSSRFWQYIVFQGWFDQDPELPDENWELYRIRPGDPSLGFALPIRWPMSGDRGLIWIAPRSFLSLTKTAMMKFIEWTLMAVRSSS